MKLIVNLEPLIGQLTGVGHYARELVSRLANQAEVLEIAYFVGHKQVSASEAAAIIEQRIFLKDDLPSGLKHWIITMVKLRVPEFLWLLSRMIFWIRTFGLKDHIYLELNNIPRPFRGRNGDLS